MHFFRSILPAGDLLLIKDLDGSLGSQPRELGGRECEIYIRSNVLRRHNTISAAVCLASYDRDLRDRSFGKCEKQLCSVTYDSSVLLLNSRQKPRHILKRYQRNIEAIAKAHKAGSLYRSIDVEYAGKVCRLIRDDSNRTSSETGEAHDDVPRIVFVHFEEISIVHDRVYNVPNIVWNI